MYYYYYYWLHASVSPCVFIVVFDTLCSPPQHPEEIFPRQRGMRFMFSLYISISIDIYISLLCVSMVLYTIGHWHWLVLYFPLPRKLSNGARTAGPSTSCFTQANSRTIRWCTWVARMRASDISLSLLLLLFLLPHTCSLMHPKKNKKSGWDCSTWVTPTEGSVGAVFQLAVAHSVVISISFNLKGKPTWHWQMKINILNNSNE